MNYSKKMLGLFTFVFIVLGIAGCVVLQKKRLQDSRVKVEQKQDVSAAGSLAVIFGNNAQHAVKEFSVVMSGQKKLTDRQIKEHLTLYAGYVNKWNEVESTLQTADRTKANPSYCLFRSLKVAETFVRNGSLLHELYFENIGVGTHVGPLMQDMINKNFGSIEAFKEDLMATALSARGWAITCYNFDDQQMHNYLLDTHNQMVPFCVAPLLVIDSYEHAYMIDFGINRKEYLAVLWDNINWDVIEKRLQRWIAFIG